MRLPSRPKRIAIAPRPVLMSHPAECRYNTIRYIYVRSKADEEPVYHTVEGKGFPYSLSSVGPGADPGVQAVSPQLSICHPPSGRLPLLSARPAVTFPAAEHHRPLAGTKLYCLVTDTHRCEQLAQGFTQLCPK